MAGGLALRAAFQGSTCLVTGNTGFKGSWLSLWLDRLGAKVVGYSLAPPTEPNLFGLARLADTVLDHRGDIADLEEIEATIRAHRPSFIFHLAALPIVRTSLGAPVETFATNVMGLVNVLEAVRRVGDRCNVVVVTSDKCYEDQRWHYGYRETDRLGGAADPYSASKAAQEIVVASYRHSYFGDGSGVRLSSARAGNVLGGGDWGEGRIIPDLVRAFEFGRELVVRNPHSTRPWQHVLQPLSGYLVLAASLASEHGERYANGWNFGPGAAWHTVGELVDLAVNEWGCGSWRLEQVEMPVREAGLLALAIDRARTELGWRPVWDVEATVSHTISWYKCFLEADSESPDMRQRCLDDIASYEMAATAAGLDWFS